MIGWENKDLANLGSLGISIVIIAGVVAPFRQNIQTLSAAQNKSFQRMAITSYQDLL